MKYAPTLILLVAALALAPAATAHVPQKWGIIYLTE